MTKNWYTYETVTQFGNQSGNIVATSKNAARKDLENRIGKLISIHKRKSLPTSDFWNFFTLLNELLEQEYTLTQSLQILQDQDAKNIRYAATQIEKLLSEGVEFISTIKLLFPNSAEVHLSMLEIGYKSAGLKSSLNILMRQKKLRDDQWKQVKKVTAYPLFLLLVSVIVLITIFDLILPSMSNILESNPNPITQLILRFAGKGYVIFTYLIWSLVGTVGVGVLVQKNTILRQISERLIFATPFIGSIYRGYVKNVFLQNLSTALELRSELQVALKLSVKFVPSYFYRRILAKVEFDVLEGTTLTRALSRTKLFRKAEISRIQIGEETSNLPNVLRRLHEQNAKDSENNVATSLQLLGPITVVFLGFLVFIIAYVVMQPMLAIQQSL